MVTIEAIIKPHELGAVQKALLGIGIQGMTVFEVKEYGGGANRIQTYRSTQYQIDYQSKLQINFVIPETLAEKALGTIHETAGAGKPGGPKRFVSRSDSVVRVRTSEMAPETV